MNDKDKESTIHPDLARPYLPDLEDKVPVLKVLTGTLKGKEYQLEGEEMLIGRGKSSNIVIDEKEVSRRHAMIVKKTSQFLLCDLDSTNGVYVNNFRLKKHVLKHGDLFQIGSCIFQFVWRQNKYEIQSKGR